ncbi:MAG: patatin-like phospholipase family protein [Anaerolineales bacterium]|nr:patatin-like phospholipase family protein [Anaerolineales bacterium]
MDIGLALSGGGFRATVYHLGVLARLAEENRLEDISFLSTVSGGSLCAGLVYAQSGFEWPGSQAYLNDVLPAARHLMTTEDLQYSLIRRILRYPFWGHETRADDLSDLLRERWGVTALLSELPPSPRWLINTTCYETGRNWRFERIQIGDYIFGYTADTDVPVSEAMAASSGFPGLIGALNFDTTGSEWFRYASGGELPPSPESPAALNRTPIEPMFPAIHLWDGGLYDNLGLEALHNFLSGWRQGVDFLIASDATGRPGVEAYRIGVKAAHRITDILMDQVRSLRSRAVLERMIQHQDPGGFLRIGNSCKKCLMPPENPPMQLSSALARSQPKKPRQPEISRR